MANNNGNTVIGAPWSLGLAEIVVHGDGKVDGTLQPASHPVCLFAAATVRFIAIGWGRILVLTVLPSCCTG